ncbi:hypothetical protein EBU24_03840 [bacterium]|nr:hypothetical protein [bacterium]
MPRLPIDYSRTVIYRISCNDLPEFIYVGSTTDFAKRKSQHKKDSKTKDIKLYQTIRENGNWDNWRMTIIEEYPDCKSCIEQRIREQKWIDELNANLNSQKAHQTKEQKKEYDKKHYEEHKEQIKEQQKENQKEYQEQHKEQKKEYNKKYHEEHKEQNKERIKQRNKEYYEKTKKTKSTL